MRHAVLVMMVFVISIASNQRVTPPGYLEVEPLAGDGVYSLLRRYELDRFTCNHSEFYKINKLKKNSKLFPGKKYKLPVLLYTYDGKSIRTSLGKPDLQLALRIQAYNTEMLERNLRTKTFQSSKILWVPYHELNCPAPTIPKVEIPDPEVTDAAAKPRHYAIFGSDYAYTPLESNRLKGKVYYVVSGHGGPDPGAQGKHGKRTLCEDEYAYDVSLRLVRNLIAHGATAYMITRDHDDGIRSGNVLKCDSDEVAYGNLKMPVSQKARLFQRSDAINDLYEKHRKQGVVEQRGIEIHIDSRSYSMRTDVFFYYKSGSKEGQALATSIQKTFVEKYKKYRRGSAYQGTTSTRDLHMLRETKPTMVYIELANIKNRFDQQRIVLESNRQALANWLFEGICR
jgi:N-acetylmuramoyl-L-alanine amidase